MAVKPKRHTLTDAEVDRLIRQQREQQAVYVRRSMDMLTRALPMYDGRRGNRSGAGIREGRLARLINEMEAP